MFGTRNPEPGKGEGKKLGKKEKSRWGKIKFFFFLFGYSWKTQGKKDKESIFPCLIIYDLKESDEN